MNIKKFIQPALSFFAGMITICIFILLTSPKPFSALNVFFTKPFTSVWYFSLLLEKASLLLFSSIGAAFAFKTGNFNLGGEGQIYFAGFLTAVLLRTENVFPASIYFFVVLIIVMLSTGLLGFVSGILKSKFEIDELLTSFLISAMVIPAVNYLIAIPMRDISGSLLATAPISDFFLLNKLFAPFNFNVSFFWAIVLSFAFVFFFSRTKSGYRFSVSGIAKEFSVFAGFSKTAPSIIGMTVSAVMHSLSGFFAITGTWGLCHLNFSAGMGWSAIVVALIARQNMIALIPVSFLYAWIQSASDAAVMSGKIKINVSIFFQAAVFLFISANFISSKGLLKKLKMNRGKK